MDQRKIKDLRLPLGFTFSFPCRQEGLTSARLVNWTKGFKCKGVEGEDVVELLRRAIKRRGVSFVMMNLKQCVKYFMLISLINLINTLKDIDIEVMAVVNDTTGTLMSCAHKNRECRVGLIVGECHLLNQTIRP